MLFDVALSTTFQVEKRVVFLMILAVARMVIWMTQKKGLYDDINFYHDPILFLGISFGSKLDAIENIWTA